ncbi:MAG: hypothetical protein ABIM99_02860 [Candidatus Dojkabacteria bacterium]
MEITIKPGFELTQEELNVINTQRVLKFETKKIWDHAVHNYFHDWLFVLVKEGDQLKAFGDMEDVVIYFDNLSFPIIGFGGIISIEEGKGYGKALMKAMVTYSNENEETLVGFCDPKNRDFYLKSGLKVKEKGTSNFFHKNEEGKEANDTGDVIYYSQEENEITKAIESNKKIIHLVPHW